MAESKSGEEFVTHEYDEAIAVQRGIVDAETALADLLAEFAVVIATA